MTNNKIVLASITVIVAAGLLALSPSMMIGNAQAEMYDNQYGYDNNYYQDDNSYYQDDNRYSYDKKDQKSSHTDIQKINCGNSNVNVNGVDVTEIPRDNTALGAANEGAGPEAANTENGNGFADKIDFNRNLVNICANANDNEQTRAPIGETQPPDGVTLFTCPAESNLAQAQEDGQELPVVTDEELCNAATRAELCTDGDLAGVWVVPPADEEACNIETEAGTVTATTYENAGNTDTSGTAFSSTATCDMDDVATGGGFTKTSNVGVDLSQKTATGEGWIVLGSGPAGGTTSLTAVVECLNNPLS
jgi:hypothetical protein